MPSVTLHIGETGKLEGLSERDKRAYAKFKKRLKTLGDGSVLFTWREPRSGPYHRRFFKMFWRFFDAQEQFQSDKYFLEWLKVGADFADLLPGPKGKPVAIAQSIAWDKLDQAEFEPIAQAIWTFMRSTYATRFLWPHLSDELAGALVNSILAEFGE